MQFNFFPFKNKKMCSSAKGGRKKTAGEEGWQEVE
jgi:hypothetical protein